MPHRALLALLLVAASPALAQSELEGSPIHPPPLRIVPAPSLKPAAAAPAASADHAPMRVDPPSSPSKPRKKRQSQAKP